MERIHIVKYEVGGLYHEHCDFFDNYEREWVNEGGQRIKSVLIYLNDDFEGGETVFIDMCKIIKPERNKMVIWDNVLEDGSPDEESTHAGQPVTSGSKLICIVWIRERKYEE